MNNLTYYTKSFTIFIHKECTLKCYPSQFLKKKPYNSIIEV